MVFSVQRSEPHSPVGDEVILEDKKKITQDLQDRLSELGRQIASDEEEICQGNSQILSACEGIDKQSQQLMVLSGRKDFCDAQLAVFHYKSAKRGSIKKILGPLPPLPQEACEVDSSYVRTNKYASARTMEELIRSALCCAMQDAEALSDSSDSLSACDQYHFNNSQMQALYEYAALDLVLEGELVKDCSGMHLQWGSSWLTAASSKPVVTVDPNRLDAVVLFEHIDDWSPTPDCPVLCGVFPVELQNYLLTLGLEKINDLKSKILAPFLSTSGVAEGLDSDFVLLKDIALTFQWGYRWETLFANALSRKSDC